MKLPRRLRDALLPFQLEGVKFGLRRQGRCLITDEMGLARLTRMGKQYVLIYLNAGNCNSLLLKGRGPSINSVSSCSALYLGGGIGTLGSFISSKRYSSWCCNFINTQEGFMVQVVMLIKFRNVLYVSNLCSFMV
uniref:Uncharacterized protein n=2 Tax=Aegilops tauschii subsp. strangulata TaxID=200361 RepID=A0A453L970_AEGTS